MNRNTYLFFACAAGLHCALLFGVSLPGQKHPPRPPQPPHVQVELVEPEPVIEEPPPSPPKPEPVQETPPSPEPPPPEPPPKVVEEPPPPTPEPPPVKALTEQAPVAEPEKAEFKVAAAKAVVAEPPKDIPLSPPQPKVVPANIVVKAQPQYRYNPEPEYPLQARRRRQEGLVLLTVLLDAKGSPTKVELKETSGYSTLDDAAIEAVRAWQFEPAQVDGQAVASEVEVPVRFKLKK